MLTIIDPWPTELYLVFDVLHIHTNVYKYTFSGNRRKIVGNTKSEFVPEPLGTCHLTGNH